MELDKKSVTYFYALFSPTLATYVLWEAGVYSTKGIGSLGVMLVTIQCFIGARLALEYIQRKFSSWKPW